MKHINILNIVFLLIILTSINVNGANVTISTDTTIKTNNIIWAPSTNWVFNDTLKIGDDWVKLGKDNISFTPNQTGVNISIVSWVDYNNNNFTIVATTNTKINFSIAINASSTGLIEYDGVNYTDNFTTNNTVTTWRYHLSNVTTPASTCGDSTCDANESCSTCSADCGTCPTGGGGVSWEDIITNITMPTTNITGDAGILPNSVFWGVDLTIEEFIRMFKGDTQQQYDYNAERFKERQLEFFKCLEINDVMCAQNVLNRMIYEFDLQETYKNLLLQRGDNVSSNAFDDFEMLSYFLLLEKNIGVMNNVDEYNINKFFSRFDITPNTFLWSLDVAWEEWVRKAFKKGYRYDLLLFEERQREFFKCIYKENVLCAEYVLERAKINLDDIHKEKNPDFKVFKKFFSVLKEEIDDEKIKVVIDKNLALLD